MRATTLTEGEVRERLAGAIRSYGAGTQAGWARAHRISAPYVSDVLAGRKQPGPAILVALGLKKPETAVAEIA